MLIIRLAKIAIVAALACYVLLVAYNNVVDYGSNYEFVRHVLSMDTTFPGNALMRRAIADETAWKWAYGAIIVTEWATGLLLTVGGLALLARLRAPALVPRTRSSHNIAASPVANFGFKAALES